VRQALYRVDNRDNEFHTYILLSWLYTSLFTLKLHVFFSADASCWPFDNVNLTLYLSP